MAIDGPSAAPGTAACTSDAAAAAERPMRADARRNRDTLLAVAREELATHGGGFAMDAVAARAGLGVGTLYRHFPTRGALVEAVYAAELDDLTRAAGALLDHLNPDAALREWLARYSRFAATKRGMIDTLRAGAAEGRSPMQTTRERITAAVAPLLEAGAADGSLRSDVQPDDVTLLLHGVFVATSTSTDADQATRLLDLVMDSLRPRR